MLKFIPFPKSRKAQFIVGGLIVILFLAVAVVAVIKFGPSQASGDNTVIYTFSLKKTMEAHPKWERYQQLSQEIKALQEKLSALGLVQQKPVSGSSFTDKSNAGVQSDLGQLFQNELQVRMEMSSDAMKRLEQDIQAELGKKMKDRNERIVAEIDTAVKDKQTLYEQKLKEYSQEMEFQYSLKITNIEFKLKVPGLTDEETKKLSSELQSLKEEKVSLIMERQKTYSKELQEFVQRREKAAQEELEQYLKQLQEEAKRRMELQQLRLQDELNDWRQDRLKDYEKKVEARRQEHSGELLSLQALQAEQNSLQVTIKREIRDYIREMALEQGPTVVLVDPLVQVGENDLTTEIVNHFQ